MESLIGLDRCGMVVVGLKTCLLHVHVQYTYITDDMKQRHFVIEQAGRGASSALVCLNSRFFFFFFWSIIGASILQYSFLFRRLSHERKEGIRFIKL